MMSLRTPNGIPTDILNIAHRGARAFAPENTLAAFQKAKLFACQMFEMDVRLSKDRELIVHHDEQLTRCTDVKLKFPDRKTFYVEDFTYDELITLDAGSWYVEQLSLPALQRQEFLQSLTDEEITRFVTSQDIQLYASGNIKIPTLKQTLEFARHAEIMVNVELKTPPNVTTELAEAVVKLVELMKMDDQVVISSFAHDQLKTVRQLTKTIAIAILTSDKIENLTDYLRLLDADAYHPNCYSEPDSTGSRKLNGYGITSVRSTGRYVNGWTCNNKDDMRQLITAGVTGLISDFPNRVQDILLEYE
ncbi:glycerophosphodiester phosphodiesterase family protein [Methylobacter sp. S3L5C]|uniref:glycerophosphodiester phosphodiesterase n=1 Tax=Methylobacter sp. S3L5C TaxID=2839024 RepID=UPI001FAE73FF|nr:glycerophosphodiester phosphodiesterase family protein [Methylobacter sp. S3L5C]